MSESVGSLARDAGIFFALCMLFIMVSEWKKLMLFLCSNSGRNRVEGQFVEETIPNEYSIQFPSVNLESCVINSLPVSQFKKDEVEGEASRRHRRASVALPPSPRPCRGGAPPLVEVLLVRLECK